MDNFLWLIITVIIAPLAVFFISEHIKSIRNDRILFKRLWMRLYEILSLLERIKSSWDQFIEIISKYSIKQIGSIGFPKYEVSLSKEIIPTVLYYKNWELFKQIFELQKSTYHLNESLQDLLINEIKDDLLSWRISEESSQERYNNEIEILAPMIKQIPSQIRHVKKLLAQTNLINTYKSLFNFIKIRLNFSKEEIEKEIINIETNQNLTLKKIEEYPTGKY